MNGRRQKGARQGLIYFVQPQGVDVVKIGFTSRPIERRLKTFQVFCWTALVLLHVTPGTEADEDRLHDRFQHLHIRGEWFRAEVDLLAHIHAAKQNAQPLADAPDLEFE